MPVSKHSSKNTGLRAEVADLLSIDSKYIYLLDKAPKGQSEIDEMRPSGRSVLAIWTAGWSDAEVARCLALKDETKALAAKYNCKVYTTTRPPVEQELAENDRRKKRLTAYLERNVFRREAAKELFWREVQSPVTEHRTPLIGFALKKTKDLIFGKPRKAPK